MYKMFFYNTKIGRLALVENNSSITHLIFENEICNMTNNMVNNEEVSIMETPTIKYAAKQLKQYFEGKLKEFDVPLFVVGTSFMLSVWNELSKIPYGQTTTYEQIAKNIGNAKASRAVGNANNRNPIPIFIPCHRVIGKNGKLTGYRGGLEIKEQLLNTESTRNFILKN